MRVLLDTHTFLWWAADDENLSDRVRVILADPNNQLFFSVVSAQEIIIKTNLGKLSLPEPADIFIPSRVAHYQLQILPVTMPHVLRLNGLKQHHRDPFDRLLISQSLVEKLPFITIDKAIGQYDVDVIW